jgi:DNA-binding winged helix-turn-helix (wHTH) protein
MPHHDRQELYRFGYFDLNVTALELCSRHARVALAGKPFQLLVYLVRHRHRVITKQEIYEQVWLSRWDPSLGNVVEAALTVLRSALSNDDPKEPRYVRTIRGHGIRFIADVTDSPAPFRDSSDRVSKLIARGWHSWNLRTKESFWSAVSCFEEASSIEPHSLAAFEGLATTYLMLGTYALHDPAEAYAHFQRANLRAVELGGWTSRLSTNRAHALHLYERRLPEAESILLDCSKSGAKVIETYLSLSMLYVDAGRWTPAREALQTASQLNELSPALPALRTFLEFMARNFESAVQEGWRAVELHPYTTLGRVYLAQALELSGGLDTALSQLQMVCSHSPGTAWAELLLARCLARSGRTTDAEDIIRKIAEPRTGCSSYVDDYFVALALDGLGQGEKALNALERAFTRGSVSLFMMRVDPRWDRLRCDGRFQSLTLRLEAP